MQNNNTYAKQSDKRKKSQQKATAIFNKKNYKNISIRVKPDQADEIRATAENLHQSLAQLIINAVRAYADIQTAGAEPAQPETVTTETPMKSGKTAGAQPEEETEEETEDIPEELKAVRAAWARMGAFNEKITAERKRREAEERERRREITDEERYMMR